MNLEEKQEALKYLEKNELLDYGVVIKREVFEKILNIEFQDNWNFLGPFLSMKQFLEENGYLCTTEAQQAGYLRIFDTDEIAYRADKILKNSFKRMKRLQTCLTNAKATEFSTKDYKQHMHSLNKVNASLNSLKSNLVNI